VTREPGAQWLGSPNYWAQRNGYSMAIAPAWIVLHTMVGDVPGATARFQQSSQQASAHYGVGYDGALYQWVDEDDAAWHAIDDHRGADTGYINENSIGIEHSDMGRPNGPRPDVLYAASARLVRDICNRYRIPIAVGNVTLGISGIVPHFVCTATSCPDGLDWLRIIREAAAAPPSPPPPISPEEDDEMRLKIPRADGSWDHVYVCPDGTMEHAHETAANVFDFREPVKGQWAFPLSGEWASDGSLHVRAVGWTGGPLVSVSAGDDGAIFEVVWRPPAGWGTPSRLV
jgi:hypothetical protein